MFRFSSSWVVYSPIDYYGRKQLQGFRHSLSEDEFGVIPENEVNLSENANGIDNKWGNKKKTAAPIRNQFKGYQ